MLDGANFETFANKALALKNQMNFDETHGSIGSSHPLTHVRMREMRREASAISYKIDTILSALPNKRDFPTMLLPKATTSKDTNGTPVLEYRNVRDVLQELKPEYDKSLFVKNNGKAIYDRRPKNLPALVKVTEWSKDAWHKLYVYGRKHPYQLAAILVATVIAKILFVIFVWGAMEESINHLLGLKKKKKEKTEDTTTAVS